MYQRRQFLRSMAAWGVGAGTGLLGATQSLGASQMSAAFLPDTRIRVFDADFDVRPYLKKMKNDGALVICRYYARGLTAPCNWEGKLLRRGEADAILDKGLGIVTVFQHCASSAGDFGDPIKGETDAQWAVKRAIAAGQPKGTVIYFAIDYDAIPDDADCVGANTAAANLRRYFDQVWANITYAGWRVGVYGPGRVCKKLKEWGLAEYFWLSASVGHGGHAEFYNSRQWHLFQNKTELPLYEPAVKLVDANVTNPNFDDFGQWRRTGAPPRVDAATATAILAARRFIKVGTVYRERNATTGELNGPMKLGGGVGVIGGRSCVLVGAFEKGVAAINLQEGTGIDAYCRLGDLTASLERMPAMRTGSCER
jgi:Domain of unknown function (DUF1906)